MENSFQSAKPNPLNPQSQNRRENASKSVSQFSSIGSDCSVDFLCQKVHSDEQWSQKAIALEEICTLCETPIENESDLQTIVRTLVDFVSERRSRMHIKVSEALLRVIENHTVFFVQFLDDNFEIFVERAIKSEECAYTLISTSLLLNTEKFAVLLAQMATTVKSLKDKTIILDILNENIAKANLSFSKMETVTKQMCQIVDKHSTHREICSLCLSILSLFNDSFA